MPFGYLDTQFIDFPAGTDAAYLQGLRTRAGVDFPQLLAEIDQRLAALNNGLDPLVAALIRTTTEPAADTTRPTAFVVDEAGEYTLARPQTTEGTAIMLPIRKYDVALGFTEDGLESMSMAKILNNIDSMLNGYRLLWRKSALLRLLSALEVRVDAKTTGTSPGFAGSGSGTNVFAGPYPNGQALPGGYTHYYRIAAGGLAAGIKAARDRLKKWYSPPYDLLTNQTQVDLIAALPEYVSAGSELVRVGNGTAEAMVDASTFVGVYDKDIRVRMAAEDFTSAHIAIFKTFGPLNEQNPLAWRYDEQQGRAAYIRSRSLYPLDNAVLLQKFGIGVNNRVAATLIYVAASGAYVEPTFAY